MNKLIIIGASGLGFEVADLAERCGYKIEGFLDDAQDVDQEYLGYQFKGAVSEWINYPDCEFIIAIGSPRIRKLIVEKMVALGCPNFATLVHPSVELAPSINISNGVIIAKGAILTVKIEIGEHVILNVGATVGHETRIDSYSNIAPQVAISGNVTIHSCVEIGTGAAVKQGLTLASGSMLGMGSVLTKDITSALLFFGAPAKKIKELAKV